MAGCTVQQNLQGNRAQWVKDSTLVAEFSYKKEIR